MKTLAKSSAVFLLAIFSTGSPIFAINLVTSDFTINLEVKLLFLVDKMFCLFDSKYHYLKIRKNQTIVDKLIPILYEVAFDF